MDTDMTFLEISLPTRDIRASLAWYIALGFDELQTADIRPWHYAVVTDGTICLGLHGEGIDSCGVTFVKPDLATYVRSEAANKFDFDMVKLGSDDFHEVAMTDPAGNKAVIVEARTFSPSSNRDGGTVSQLDSVALPCRDIAASAAFWEELGMVSVVSDDDMLYELHSPGLKVVLEEDTRALSLYYHNDNIQETAAHLNLLGIPNRTTVHGLELRSPEGTRIILSEPVHA